MAPTISLVVPAYDVAPYLDACLRSLAAQTHRDLEVVVVDDGSADDSGRIAAKFAADDPRFRVITREHQGLGAARNAGLAETSGEFLAFVDGDDMLPPYALEYLLASLQETGADFATGNVHRFDADGARQAPTLRRTFRDTVRRTHVTRHEDLLVDRMVTNKLWRRSFWDAQGLEFPRGALHDDSLIAITAHHLADAVDVLEAPVYLWRVHPGEDRSLTRNGPEGSVLEHRVQAVRAVGRFLLDRGMPEQKRLWDRVVLSDDLRLFLQALDEGDDAYRQRFLDLAGAYLRDCDPDIVGGLRAIERLKWHLVERRMLPELLEVLTFEKSREMADAGVVRRGVRFYGDYPFLNDPRVGVPDHVYRLDEELQVRQKVDAVGWNGDRLVVEGRAKLRYLPPRKRWQQQLLAWLVSEETGQRLPLRLTTVDRAGDDDGADWSGYRIVIDPAKLLGKGSSWHVELWIHNRGIFRREELSRPSAAARRLEARRVGEVWVRPEWAKGGRFVLRTGDDAVIVTDMRPADGALELTCEAPTGLLWGSHLLATRWPGCAPRRYPLTRHPDGTGFTARMPMRDFEAPVPSPGFPAGSPEAAAFGDTTQWAVELVGSDGTRTPLILPEVSRLLRHEAGGDREVAAVRTKSGHLEIHERAVRPVLDVLEWEPDGPLRIAGELPSRAELPAGLVLRAGGRVEERVFPLTRDDGRFEAELDPWRVRSLAGTLPLPKGRYQMYLRLTRDGGTRDAPIQVGNALRTMFPLTRTRDGRTLHMDVTKELTPLLRVNGDLTPEERSRKGQRLLTERVYPELCEQPLRPQVFFESYYGRQYSDSPRAILEELRRRDAGLEFVWSVRDGQVELPEGITPVRRGGREYVEALACSKYVVVNSHLPWWFRRRPGQTVLQTWHGATLKRIGFDIERVRFATRDYHERLALEVEQWDYLVSPSPWCTPIMRRAFRFEGEVLETGYPRNDLFFAEDRDEIARAVRQRIGVPEGRKVILYAPTWRDDKFYTRGRYRLDLKLDLRRMQAELGEDHVVLVRRHPHIVDRVPEVGRDFVFDVSVYPQMQELLLITDVLVTDYSSVMFDFAITRRPMLFFTYDLESYRDELRGFYFDFESDAPGPLLRTGDEVIAALRDIDRVVEEHADAYRAFTDRHCALDDGGATARVVDRVFG